MIPYKRFRRPLAWLISLLMLLAAWLPCAALADDDADEPENVFEPLVFDDPGTPPSYVADDFNGISPNLRLEAFPVSVGKTGKPDVWKFTLYGTENLLVEMKEQLTDKEAPFPFRYVLEIQGDPTFTFEGNIAYGERKSDSFANVTRFNMVVKVGDYRYQNGVHCKRSADNQLSWLVEMPLSAHFAIDGVRGYSFSIYSANNREQRLTYTFDPDIQTDTALYTPARRGAALKINMPTPQEMTFTILDPRIPDGYTNSPEKKGDVLPYWHVKIVLSALEWFEVILDGTNGEPMDDMKLYCGHYRREPDDSNKYSPRSRLLETAQSCDYAIDGNQIAFSLQYPDGSPVDFTYIDYILVDMSNGVTFRVSRYPMF